MSEKPAVIHVVDQAQKLPAEGSVLRPASPAAPRSRSISPGVPAEQRVHAGQTVQLSYSAPQTTTSRWRYFITRANWDPSASLTRAQFEPHPFHTVEPDAVATRTLSQDSPTVQDFSLPERQGYHVLLAVWEVADTGNAFYQAIDLDFAE
ncbi:lytic polysaccharide monooxygenase auxiliary activity family 9 protein [Streptomyces noursei]|uniref:lytic polysaccharide monooxygenase auxiliary activity family 9 protein n=1 Tax=Streptomyces noursei TaxID=1971 RepID=UPI0033DAE16F